jgi:NAD-dependent aldehyde dehydrogenases
MASDGYVRRHLGVQLPGSGVGVECALALVCGNAVIWKPSEKTPLTALAVNQILSEALQEFGDAPAGLTPDQRWPRVGAKLVADPRASIVSATGSTEMGRTVGVEVAKRFGRSLLELGGNNAGIVAQTADHELAMRGILFSAVGTAGQRCTSLRVCSCTRACTTKPSNV